MYSTVLWDQSAKTAHKRGANIPRSGWRGSRSPMSSYCVCLKSLYFVALPFSQHLLTPTSWRSDAVCFKQLLPRPFLQQISMSFPDADTDKVLWFFWKKKTLGWEVKETGNHKVNNLTYLEEKRSAENIHIQWKFSLENIASFPQKWPRLVLFKMLVQELHAQCHFSRGVYILKRSRSPAGMEHDVYTVYLYALQIANCICQQRFGGYYWWFVHQSELLLLRPAAMYGSDCRLMSVRRFRNSGNKGAKEACEKVIVFLSSTPEECFRFFTRLERSGMKLGPFLIMHDTLSIYFSVLTPKMSCALLRRSAVHRQSVDQQVKQHQKGQGQKRGWMRKQTECILMQRGGTDVS